MYGAGGGGKPGERFSFFFLRFRSLQGDCDGSSKQAFGGPQPARLSERFLLYSSLYLRGDRLDRFTHEHRQSRVPCTATATVAKVILDRTRLTPSLRRTSMPVAR